MGGSGSKAIHNKENTSVVNLSDPITHNSIDKMSNSQPQITDSGDKAAKRVKELLSEQEAYDLSKKSTMAEVDSILNQHINKSRDSDSYIRKTPESKQVAYSKTTPSSFNEKIIESPSFSLAKSKPNLSGGRKNNGSPVDFILDDEPTPSNLLFDDGSEPSLIGTPGNSRGAGDIRDFLMLQRQRTVTTLKNAQLEMEVAVLEQQLREMEMQDAAHAKSMESKPTVAVMHTRLVLSGGNDRPLSGAAVVPEPLPNIQPDSTRNISSREKQKSRGSGKDNTSLLTVQSASTIEVIPVKFPYTDDKLSSPPPSPPSDSSNNSPDLHRVSNLNNNGFESDNELKGIIKHAESLSTQRRFSNGKISDGIKADEKISETIALNSNSSNQAKPVMKFHQAPHGLTHSHRRNKSEDTPTVLLDDNISENQKNSTSDLHSHQNVITISRKKGVSNHQKDNSTLGTVDNNTNLAVVTRKKNVNKDNIMHLDDKAGSEKRLLLPVATPGHVHKSHYVIPGVDGPILQPRGSSLSPLPLNGSLITDDADRVLKEKSESSNVTANSSATLAPLPIVPTFKSSEDTSRVASVAVSGVKEKSRANNVLQNFNRRRTRTGTEEESINSQPLFPSAVSTLQAQVQESSVAIAYMQMVSPREEHNTEDPPSLSSKLSNRINGSNSEAFSNNNHNLKKDVSASIEAKPPQGEPMPSKATSITHAPRQRRNRVSNVNLENMDNNEAKEVHQSHLKKNGNTITDAVLENQTQNDREEVEIKEGPTHHKKKNVHKKRKSYNTDDEDKDKVTEIAENKANGFIPYELGALSADARSRPWSQTMNLRLGEVEFMLRKPITTDADVYQTLAAAEAGLLFMEELNSVAKSLNMLRGSLSRWLLPYDDKTRIDEQSSNVRSVVDNMPDYLVGLLTEKQVTYLVTGLNSVRQLIRIKIADDNDLEQARTALELTQTFFHRLTDEAKALQVSPYELFNSKRF